MNVADVITEFGAYYIAQGQNESRIVRTLRDRSVTEELFTSRITDDTVYRATRAQIDRLLQPFQKGWTPIGTLEFTPIAITQYPIKMDFEEYPDELEATWLGFLADNNLSRAEWPFVRWLIEKEILPQMHEDFENNEVFDGVYAAPTPGTAGAAGTAINGIKTIRNAHIAGGRITPITMGAFPAAPSGDKSVEYLVCEYFEDFADQINDKYWGLPMEIACSPLRHRQFLRGYAAKYGTHADYTKNTNAAVDFTNLRLRGLPSHRGAEIIWCTPKENAIRLMKKSVNENRVEVEGEDRKVKIWTDFYKGIDFLIPEIVFTNDLETV